MKVLKSIFLAAALLFVSNFVSAQKLQWKEKDEFHNVMSTTFHPAEEGNFKPIRTRSAEMAAKAESWRKSAIPADVLDRKSVKKNLNKLCKDTKSLDKKIKKGISDADLKNELSNLHDTFHTIVGLCDKKEEGEHDHQH